MDFGLDTERHAAPLPAPAIDDLRYLRRTLERSAAFSGMSGRGWMLIGLTAPLAAWIARGRDPIPWTIVWGVEALLAFTIGLVTTLSKCRSLGVRLTTGPGRRFAGALGAPLLAGGLLTACALRESRYEALPGIWLLLYGVAIVSGGAFSVRAVPMAGLAFLAIGAVTLFSPPGLGGLALALGFGGIHLVFGAVIAWRHGG